MTSKAPTGANRFGDIVRKGKNLVAHRLSQFSALGASKARVLEVTLVGIIALMSIGSAVTAYRASLVSSKASEIDREGLQQLLQEEQFRATNVGTVSQDLRLLTRYQEHVEAYRILLGRASKLADEQPLKSDLFATESQGQLAEARSINQFIQVLPPFAPEEGPHFDLTFEVGLEQLADLNQRFRDLRPNDLFGLAEETHRRAAHLVALVILWIVGLLVATIGQFAKGRLVPWLTLFAFSLLGVSTWMLLVLGDFGFV
jgi:hypothetical protein